MLFSSNKSSIIWDSQSLHVIELSFDINDVSSATPKVIQELRSDGGEIADVSTSGDDLVVLTRFATGAEWRRYVEFIVSFSELILHSPWKRRFDEGEDFWAGNRPLYTYAITAYSVERHLQIGETVQIPYHGVYASIRSGFHKAVVRMIGPKCVSTFWDLPTQESPKWRAVHAELSWVCSLPSYSDTIKVNFNTGSGDHCIKNALSKLTGRASIPRVWRMRAIPPQRQRNS
jgi:hypothetical protein